LKKDEYKSPKTISSEVLYKDKGSKFFGYVFPVEGEDEINQALEQVKSKHHKARHFCYAWQLGKNYNTYKVNDDGEPNNSAGMPIYGQLQAFEVTNCLIVVVRYFGGTKLGVGGLISAYKTTAKMALEATKIVTNTIDQLIQVNCEYDMMNEVMRLVKAYDLEIVSQELKIGCQFIISIRQKEFDHIVQKFQRVYGLNTEIL
jgi:uncharacterized YigZ family protein